MKTNYVSIFALVLLALLGLYAQHKASSSPAPQATVWPQSAAFIQQSSGDTIWFWQPWRKSQLSILALKGPSLVNTSIGDTWATFTSDSLAGLKKTTQWYKWKSRIIAQLADPTVADTIQQWQETKTKLLAFVVEESKSDGWERKVRNADELLFHRFVTKIGSLQNRKRTTYIIDRQLHENEHIPIIELAANQRLQGASIMPATATDNNLWQWMSWICEGLTVVMGVWGWWIRKPFSQTLVPEVTEQLATVETIPIAVEPEPVAEQPTTATEPTYAVEWELINRYTQQLYDRYGRLFEELQAGIFPPDDDARSRVLQQLTEMACHAHTLAFYGKMEKLGRLYESPNAQLILNDWQVGQLAEKQYRLGSDNPHETEAKYRFLRLILQQVGVGNVEALLEDNVYITNT